MNYRTDPFSPKELFIRYREEIGYEAGLISNRTGWYVTTQAFMFSAVVLGIDRAPGVPFQIESSLLHPLLPWAGVFISIGVLCSVVGGISSATLSRQALVDLVTRYPELSAGSPKRNALHKWAGLFPPVLFPVLFGGIWIILLTDVSKLKQFLFSILSVFQFLPTQ